MRSGSTPPAYITQKEAGEGFAAAAIAHDRSPLAQLQQHVAGAKAVGPVDDGLQHHSDEQRIAEPAITVHQAGVNWFGYARFQQIHQFSTQWAQLLRHCNHVVMTGLDAAMIFIYRSPIVMFQAHEVVFQTGEE